MGKEVKNKKLSLNVDEMKDFLRHIIHNNRFLQENNKIPVAVGIVGESGIGKTSISLQMAEEFNLSLIKINLAQIEELGDLVGFPIRQFEVCKEDLKDEDKKCVWIDEHAVTEYTTQGFKFTGKNRMGYCPPEWIADQKSGGILILDDWNRADVRYLQAVMELIDRQTYISWTLPKDWHILLTSNPDDGDYLVNSIDDAQESRFIGVDLKFDVKCWGRWAEENGIDGRCINFLLTYPEVIDNKNKRINARSAVMFFNSISSIKSFDDSLPLIQMIGEGSVGPDFSSMFTTFINNKLDQIMSPEDILTNENEKYVLDKLKNTVMKDKKYRADIASTIVTRIINYSIYVAKNNNIDKKFIDRLIALITSEIFENDICYQMAKSIFNGNQSKFKGLTLNSDVVKIIMK